MKTLKAAVAKYNSISLILRILVGLAVGVVLALVAPGAGWVAELGNLFVGALKGIAPVLVFVIVASALARTGRVTRHISGRVTPAGCPPAPYTLFIII
mgnify:CR=1 FL=1